MSTVNNLNPFSSTEVSGTHRGVPLEAFLITQLSLIVPSGKDVALSMGAFLVDLFPVFPAFAVAVFPAFLAFCVLRIYIITVLKECETSTIVSVILHFIRFATKTK